jgi:hypothetical protein
MFHNLMNISAAKDTQEIKFSTATFLRKPFRWDLTRCIIAARLTALLHPKTAKNSSFKLNRPQLL